MAKHIIQVEADGSQLFDTLKAVGQDGWSSFGERIASVFMTGEVGLREAMGLAIYGVEVVSIQKLRDPTPGERGE